MDDRRLRKLLEELYRDKKFMDKLISKIDQEHLGIVITLPHLARSIQFQNHHKEGEGFFYLLIFFFFFCVCLK